MLDPRDGPRREWRRGGGGREVVACPRDRLRPRAAVRDVSSRRRAPRQAIACSRSPSWPSWSGLDLVTLQDHPYQARFLDTWTLLSVIAAAHEPRAGRAERRQPAAAPAGRAGRAASPPSTSSAAAGSSSASAPARSGTRSRPMGGPRLTPGRERRRARRGDRGHPGDLGRRARRGPRRRRPTTASPARTRGPAPAHDVEIWLGAYKPRMLRADRRRRTAGCRARLRGARRAAGDERARSTTPPRRPGADPASIRRLLNVGGRSAGGDGFLGRAVGWPEQLADLTLDDRDQRVHPGRRRAGRSAPGRRGGRARGRGSSSRPNARGRTAAGRQRPRSRRATLVRRGRRAAASR